MIWLRLGAVLAALGVAAGAFGAHGLEDALTPERLETWETGARYHLVHALALCVLGALPSPPKWVGVLFAAGILLFAGSLYALVLLDLPILGAVTPLGGLAFIAGWITLAIQAPRALAGD